MGCETGEVMDAVRDGYDANAELYASLFLNELNGDAQSTGGLRRFAALAVQQSGPVLDCGCGPGGAVRFLSDLGLMVSGVDLSPGQVAQARLAFPELRFEVGDLTALEVADASLGGVVSLYSVIHLPPATLPAVFAEWFRAMAPAAPVFLSFFGSRSPEAHGTPFDHKVVTAYELWPAGIAQQLRAAGFADVKVDAAPIPEGGRPFDHTTVLAHKPA
jgi:SAM-dependent methyltransferase